MTWGFNVCIEGTECEFLPSWHSIDRTVDLLLTTNLLFFKETDGQAEQAEWMNKRNKVLKQYPNLFWYLCSDILMRITSTR